MRLNQTELRLDEVVLIVAMMLGLFWVQALLLVQTENKKCVDAQTNDDWMSTLRGSLSLSLMYV